jgi:hypothetical protein
LKVLLARNEELTVLALLTNELCEPHLSWMFERGTCNVFVVLSLSRVSFYWLPPSDELQAQFLNLTHYELSHESFPFVQFPFGLALIMHLHTFCIVKANKELATVFE